jgi:ParB family chromosome partitioning protein
MVALEDIEVNPFQPRTEFDAEELMELARSIKIHGLIQPVTLRSLDGTKYQLISGERRFRASKMSGLREIPSYIRTANDQEMLEMALIENIQRSDLNAIEIAISYQRLIDECTLTHETLSERVGKNRSTVTNYIRLLKLPPEIQNSIKSSTISMGHARALAGVDDLLKQIQAYKKTISESLSVRQLEAYLKENKPEVQPIESDIIKEKSIPKNAEINRISHELSNFFGVKIQIQRNQQGKGNISIPFKSDEEFNNIYELFKDIE